MTLQDKVIAKIKEYFPEVEVITMVKPVEYTINYGEMNEKEDPPEYEYVHKVISSNRVFYKTSEALAEDDLIKELDFVKYYKTPDVLFIRLAETNNDHDFATRQDRYLSVARFSLGYKI